MFWPILRALPKIMDRLFYHNRFFHFIAHVRRMLHYRVFNKIQFLLVRFEYHEFHAFMAERHYSTLNGALAWSAKIWVVWHCWELSFQDLRSATSDD